MPFNRSFLDPAVKGEFPPELIAIVKELDMVPAMQEDDLAIIKENTIDLLGINYYQPRRVKAKKHRLIMKMDQCQKIILIIMKCQIVK